MWRFYWRCFRLAGKGLLGVIGDFCTVFAVALAVETARHAEWTTNPETLAFVNGLGGWKLPIGLLASLSAIRLVLAPYWIYKEQADKLRFFETRRDPVFRFVRSRIPNKPQILWKSGPDKPPTAVVTFNLQFKNIGGGIAFEGFFIIHYCWVREPATVRSIVSPVSVGDTIPGEEFGWTFSIEQHPATQVLNNLKTPWWFDTAGLIMVVELCYTADAQPAGTSGRAFWLHWHPSTPYVTYASKHTAESVRPFINQHVRENEKRGLAPETKQPSPTPALRWYRKIWYRLFDY